MKNFGFPRKERVANKYEFDNICKKGKKFINPLFYLYVFPAKRFYNRIGIRIGRKFGKAYIRNRVKRIIREIYRKNKEILGGVDLVFIPRDREKLDFSGWEKNIREVFLEIKRKKI